MRHSGLILSIAAVAFGGVFAAMTFTLRFEATALAPVRKQNVASSIQIAADEPPLLSSDALFTRPLFNPTRRPFVEPKQEAEPEPEVELEIEQDFVEEKPAAEPSVRLLGIAKLGGQSIALVVEGARKEAQWLKVGEAIGEWTIAGVDRTTIILAHQSADADRKTISMFTELSEEEDADVE